MLAHAEEVTAEPGECFFHQDEPARSMFVLETGRVEVVKCWQGREFVLNDLGAGDCFGEMALMDLFPRSASVRARTCPS